MNNEAVKNGVPPPTVGTRRGLALAITSNTNENENKHDGGWRALFPSLLATSWLKKNFCTENYADLIKCTYFVVLDVCKSLRAILPSALQDSLNLSEGLQTSADTWCDVFY